MNTQRGILNFFKKKFTRTNTDEFECEDCESHNTDKTNLTQANIIDEKNVSPCHALGTYKFPNQRDRVIPLGSKHINGFIM